MIPVQNLSYFLALNPTQATNGATLTSSLVDMQGYKYATFVITGSTSNNATNVPAVLIKTADVTNATSFATDAALSGGSSAGNWAIPNSPTATDNKPWVVVNADWRGRPRYAEVLITPVTTQTFSVLVLKSRADIQPTSNAQVNVSGGSFFG